VREIVGAHDGTIRIEGQGHGSEVVLSFPLPGYKPLPKHCGAGVPPADQELGL